MKLYQLALGFTLLAPPVLAAQSDSMNLARRYVAANGGMTTEILAMHIHIVQFENCRQDIRCTGTRTRRFKVVQQAMDENRAALAAADEQLVRIVSQTFDQSELAAYLSFWESPQGRNIQDKRAAQGLAYYEQERLPAGLTMAERDALAAYLDTPSAHAIDAKEQSLLQHMMMTEMKLQMQITRNAGTIYCQRTGYCRPWIETTTGSQ